MNLSSRANQNSKFSQLKRKIRWEQVKRVWVWVYGNMRTSTLHFSSSRSNHIMVRARSIPKFLGKVDHHLSSIQKMTMLMRVTWTRHTWAHLQKMLLKMHSETYIEPALSIHKKNLPLMSITQMTKAITPMPIRPKTLRISKSCIWNNLSNWQTGSNNTNLTPNLIFQGSKTLRLITLSQRSQNSK